MGNKSSNIPVKVFISYLVLAALVISVGWILYSENVVYTNIEKKIAFEKSKVLKITKLFTNVYKTEGLARKTIQTNSEEDFKNYIVQSDSLLIRVDSLKKLVSTNYQIQLLDSVNILLSEKNNNIRQLKAIKSKESDEASVNNAIDELTKLEFSLRKLELRDFTKNPKQLGSYQRNVLQKYVDYLNQNIPDDSTNTLTKKATDSILSASKRLLSKVKKEAEKKKESVNLQENKLLKNEILISEQLRKVLRIIEREIIVYSVQNNTEKEKSLKKINQIVTAAAAIGLLLTIFFSILITSDFSKTQSYKKQLEIANFKTKNLLKSREHLISTVSHDLKTPLSTIMGYTELLSTSSLTKKQDYYTQNIRNSSEYISRLVQDLLEFSQIEAGKIAIEKISFLLPQTIDEIAKNIQSVFTEKDIVLTVTADHALEKPIIGDPFRLKQVLINLIGNAYKFTENGHIKINAAVKQNNAQLVITIEDSGIGIEADSQELVFEEFAQANENIEKEYGGTGLGLAISKRIIAILGGELRLKESSNQGSTFEITLPLYYGSEIPEIEEDEVIKTSNSSTDKTIIVVDDDKDLLTLSTEVLKQKGYTVLAYNNAQEALKTVQNTPFDLIISDIQMPIMDGFAFAKAIQETQIYNNQPIVAVTGRSDLDLSVYEEAGFTTVIKKPFSTKTLLATIEAIFNKQEIPFQDESKIIKNATELFTIASLESFLGNDNEAVKSILFSFIESTASNIIILKEAINTSDFVTVKATAHKMAPMFKQIEATKIALVLNDIESNDYDKKTLEKLFKNVKKDIDLLIAAIKSTIN
ncbi:signal transduction histidine kinase/FixJ family two-component response regulator [Flavobacterium sp. 28A]|uniref:hybrid sensor histidine kinase/response regulator n=1 Tax=Flavobacterium sp. 28A TaxID=2735895 RepID=UPI00156DB508|nr:ATP-binding protein [Flavobacterium sp. 28A]NRT14189.1 signal transduction histidine kinase/FixJ family two-component response regulator [Flavobacterium sp. 28A]